MQKNVSYTSNSNFSTFINKAIEAKQFILKAKDAKFTNIQNKIYHNNNKNESKEILTVSVEKSDYKNELIETPVMAFRAQFNSMNDIIIYKSINLKNFDNENVSVGNSILTPFFTSMSYFGSKFCTFCKGNTHYEYECWKQFPEKAPRAVARSFREAPYPNALPTPSAPTPILSGPVNTSDLAVRVSNIENRLESLSKELYIFNMERKREREALAFQERRMKEAQEAEEKRMKAEEKKLKKEAEKKKQEKLDFLMAKMLAQEEQEKGSHESSHVAEAPMETPAKAPKSPKTRSRMNAFIYLTLFNSYINNRVEELSLMEVLKKAVNTLKKFLSFHVFVSDVFENKFDVDHLENNLIFISELILLLFNFKISGDLSSEFLFEDENYDRENNVIAKFLLKYLNEIFIEILENKNKKRWSIIERIMSIRVYLSSFLGNNWIKKIFKHRNFSKNEINFNISGLYAIYNNVRSEIYIGESKDIKRRMREHLLHTNKEGQRKLYNMMDKVENKNWFMIPMEEVSLTNLRKTKEIQLMMLFRTQLLNEQSTFKIPKKYKENKYKNFNEQERLKFIKSKISRDRKFLFNLRNNLKLISTLNEEDCFKSLNLLNDNIIPKRMQYFLRSIIYKEMKMKNFDFQKNYNLNLANSKLIKKNEVKKVIFNKLLKVHPTSKAIFISNNTRITFTAVRTIKDVVKNEKRFMENVDINNLNCDLENDCQCQKYDGFSKFKNHVLCKSTEIKNNEELTNFLNINSKTNIKLSQKEFIQFQMTTINQYFGENFSKLNREDVNSIMDTINVSDLQSSNNEFISNENIRKVLSKYKYIIFQELDKNTSSWSCICPKLLKHFLIQNYNPQFNSNYEFVNKSESEVKKITENKYINLGLKLIKNGKKEWKLNAGRVIMKMKDIKKQRPLVSFFHNYGRPLGRIIARALTVMIKKSNKIWDTMELTNATKLINEINKINQSNKWKNSMKNNKMTFMKLDVKNQFSNLKQKETLLSFDRMVSAIKNYDHKIKFVSIAKNRLNKKYDGFNSNNYNYHKLNFSDIRNYLIYEMNTTYIKIGSKIIKQKEGLPMGGLISAGLASIDCMRKENENKKIWRHSNTQSKSIRYRDDILYIVTKEMNEIEVKTLHDKFEKIYGDDLEIELETVSFTEAKMLDMKVMKLNNKIETFDNNKNEDFLNSNDITKKKFRFPEIIANWNDSLYLNVMTSQLNRIYRNVNSKNNQILSALKLIKEWQILKYPKNWINKAARKSFLRIKSELITS